VARQSLSQSSRSPSNSVVLLLVNRMTNSGLGSGSGDTGARAFTAWTPPSDSFPQAAQLRGSPRNQWRTTDRGSELALEDGRTSRLDRRSVVSLLAVAKEV
jgi:hypothetical protein